MKICWDTLESVTYKSGNFYYTYPSGNVYPITYHESCAFCKESFFGAPRSSYCTKDCFFRNKDNTDIGRPKGHKLGEETKKAIGAAQVGKTKSPEIRDRISDSLKEFYKDKSLEAQEKTEELLKDYKNSGIAVGFIRKHRIPIEMALGDVWTEKKLNHASTYIELPMGDLIDHISGNGGIDPETLVILKDLYEKGRLNEFFLP